MKNVESGFCHCGCGQKTNISKDSSLVRGLIAGTPFKFLRGHNQLKSRNSRWIGGLIKTLDGYIYQRVDDHPYGSKNYVLQHRLVVEKVLGYALHPEHPVHHVDGNGLNNMGSNLVVCEDQIYHVLLHKRQKALELTGSANSVLCRYCRQYGDLQAMRQIAGSGNRIGHVHAASCTRVR